MNKYLYNQDLLPTNTRNWNTLAYISLWIGIAIVPTSYMLGGQLLSFGFNLYLTLLFIFIGNLSTSIILVLIGISGAKYRVPFPIILRTSFGIEGARVFALLRAFVACGWIGISAWLGGECIYNIIKSIYHINFLNINILGTDALHLLCFLIFCFAQAYIIYKGIDYIKKFEIITAPILIFTSIYIFCWGIFKAGSFAVVIRQSSSLIKAGNISFFNIGIALSSIIGFWAAMSINIPDFTRFAKDQRSQILGQLTAMPITMLLYCFLGIFMTSVTIILYHKPIWDPIALLGHLDLITRIIFSFSILAALLTTNVAANIIAPANDFSNLFPKYITFKMGGYLTIIIGIIILPWKIMHNDNFMSWLISYSPFLGALAGIMLCDYFIIKKGKIDIDECYKKKGKYWFTKGWNITALITFILAILPLLPAILRITNVTNYFSSYWLYFFDYGWLITIFSSFIIYLFINKIIINNK